MIFKIGQHVDGLKKYVRKSNYIMAKKMTEDFAIETGRDWQYDGKRGDWLVLVDDQLWLIVCDIDFKKLYTLVPPDSSSDGKPGPTIEVDRRIGDRRRSAG